LTYATLPGEKIGLLTINDFVEINPLLEPAFTQIRNDGIEHLIIDIRENGGGMYEQVDSVMRYLTDQPYKHCASYTLAPLVGQASSGPRNVDCELIRPNTDSLRYTGKIYLLVGPDSLSGAITFATILQDYDLATLLGEETRDYASYCAFVSDPFPLPHTSLLYRCSTRCFVRPGGILDDLPVTPDLAVPNTLADQISGTDLVLDYTLDMIRKNP
jgi:C-terminal processing protease CtpA/Prc